MLRAKRAEIFFVVFNCDILGYIIVANEVKKIFK